MSVYRVPREEWRAFLSRLSARERGSKVTLQRRPAGASVEARGEVLAVGQPLSALDVGAGGGLLVSLGDPPRDIAIAGLAELQFEQHGESAPAAIDIGRTDGSHVRLEFDHPVVPGVMDGFP